MLPDWVNVPPTTESDPESTFKVPELVTAATSIFEALELVLVKLPLLTKLVPAELLRHATGQALAVVPE